MKIWCLFSVENNYDQPQNNLVSWFKEKPHFLELEEKIKQFLQVTEVKDGLVGTTLRGFDTRIGNYDFRLEEVTELQVL